MSQTTASASLVAPGSPQRNGVSRRVAAGIIVLAVIAAAVVVRFLFTPEAVPHDPLHGDSEDAVGALAEKMAKLPPAEQQATLKRYLTDASPGLRYAAADRLGDERNNPAIAPLLESSYTDSSSIVRQRILETLPDVDRERGLHLLLAGLQDEDSWMREAAATQIKMRLHTKPSIIDRRVLPSLIAALDDTDPAVSFLVVGILQKMTGKPWHYRALGPEAEKVAVHARWKAWWETQRAHATLTLPQAYAIPVAAIAPTRTDPSPPFQLTDVDGRSVNLAAQAGHVTLLNFWGTWCPPCLKERPDLIRLDHDYRARGVDVIGVAVGEKDGADGLRKWCAAHGITYRQALAVERVQHDFGDVYEVPVSVLIDGAGRIRRRWEGERDYDTFRAAVDSVLR